MHVDRYFSLGPKMREKFAEGLLDLVTDPKMGEWPPCYYNYPTQVFDAEKIPQCLYTKQVFARVCQDLRLTADEHDVFFRVFFEQGEA